MPVHDTKSLYYEQVYNLVMVAQQFLVDVHRMISVSTCISAFSSQIEIMSEITAEQ